MPAFFMLLLGAFLPVAAVGQGVYWYTHELQVFVDGKPLDTGDGRTSLSNAYAASDRAGHAAPELYDWNGDGLQDLLVGGFAGRVRIYLNEGSASTPLFSGYDWIEAADKVARVYNHCCIPTGIQMADIDGDGLDDVTIGAYPAAGVFWFKGTVDGFSARQTLTDASGIPTLPRLDTVVTESDGSLGTKATWMDWDNDGALDLVMGTAVSGALVVRLNYGSRDDGLTVIADQPRFGNYSGYKGQINVFDFVDGGAGTLASEKKLVPEAADWDGDGLIDLIVGVDTGAVYWLRNIGEPGEPFFAPPEPLLPPLGYEAAVAPRILLRNGETVGRGSRVSVDVADYNGDGKLDLLVGDWSRSICLRDDLTKDERIRFEEIQRELVELDRQAGADGPAEPFRDRRMEDYDVGANDPLRRAMRDLEAEMRTFLQLVDPDAASRWSGYTRSHGHVWVYLRR